MESNWSRKGYGTKQPIFKKGQNSRFLKRDKTSRSVDIHQDPHIYIKIRIYTSRFVCIYSLYYGEAAKDKRAKACCRQSIRLVYTLLQFLNCYKF